MKEIKEQESLDIVMPDKSSSPAMTTIATPPTEVKSEALLTVELLSEMMKNPSVDVEKMSAILDLKERMMNKEAEQAFNVALCEAQNEMPQIEKVRSGHNSKYAPLEIIDAIIKPIYCKHGFSASYNTRKNADKTKTYFLMLSHIKGHSRTYEVDYIDDKSGSKNDIQAVGSSSSYAQRNLLKLAFNIVERNQDDDGYLGGLVCIDEHQVDTINRLLDETNSDKEIFCKRYKVPSIPELTQKRYMQAIQDIKAKQKMIENAKKKEAQ